MGKNELIERIVESLAERQGRSGNPGSGPVLTIDKDRWLVFDVTPEKVYITNISKGYGTSFPLRGLSALQLKKILNWMER